MNVLESATHFLHPVVDSGEWPIERIESDLSFCRNAARRHIAERLGCEKELVADFWAEIAKPVLIPKPELTVLFARLQRGGESFLLLEFVSGETLESLVKRADPSTCEDHIPLYCQVLDTFDQGPAAPEPGVRAGEPEVVDFGVARAKAHPSYGKVPKAFGSVLVTPGGVWSDALAGLATYDLGAVLPMVWALYRELTGELPEGVSEESSIAAETAVHSLGARTENSPAVVGTERVVNPSRFRRLALTFTIMLVTAMIILCGLVFAVGLFARMQPQENAGWMEVPEATQASPKADGVSSPETRPIPSTAPVPAPQSIAAPQDRVAPVASGNLAPNSSNRSPIVNAVHLLPPQSTPSTPAVETSITSAVIRGDLQSIPPAPAIPRVRPSELYAGLTRGALLVRPSRLVYPERAREQSVAGVVTLRVTISDEGKVENPVVLSGHPLLREGVAEAVQNWVYQPALLNGSPVPATEELELKFDLRR